jgi:signal transduction histidine kinase
MTQNQRMGFQGWAKEAIVGSNRSARLWLASALIVAVAASALYRALVEPSLGWRFVAVQSAGVAAEPVRPARTPLSGVTAIEGNGSRVDLTAALLIESAAFHNEFKEHNAFFDEHRRLWQVLQASEVRVHHGAGVDVVAPAQRGLGELGPRFWFPWLVALLSLSVGLGIWVYQPRGSATACYLAASMGYSLAMLGAATWGSRLLTQSPRGWQALHVASHTASFMVLAGLCALLWLHPRRLGGNWLIWVLAAVILLSLALDAGQWVPSFALAFRLPMVLMAGLLAALYVLQWRATRSDPGLRAQLKWFGLLLFTGLSAVSLAYAIGITGRIVNIPQNYGLGIVALLFVGLVPLVTRIGLFQLEAWWPRAWLWFLGGLLVVVLDLFLLMALGWGADIAFALALALAGWLYFPLRQWLFRRMLRGALPSTREVLPQILELVTQGQGDRSRLNQRWRSLWETVFQPHSLSATAVQDAAVGSAGEGRRLYVAAGPALEPLELGLPERGARLFNPADTQRAREICDLVRQGLASGESFERGAREERRRIASDLHDDLGAQLLTIAQASAHAGGERVAGMARQALEEMRLSVRGLAGEAARTDDVLADWRAESVTRLAAAGLQPEWLAEEAPQTLVLTARTHAQLTRILREALSNAIRHSGGSLCRVRIGFAEGELHMVIEDDGRGLLPASSGGGRGNGLANIERRVRSLRGEFRFERPDGGGTRLKVRIPLAGQSANIEST